MPSYDQWEKLTVKNEKKLIPPLALVQVPQNSFIACADGQLNLYGAPVGTSNSSLVILQNDTLTRPDIDVFNIQKYINDSDDIKLRFIISQTQLIKPIIRLFLSTIVNANKTETDETDNKITHDT
ncbi:unnamed protein product [Didymodactylos carnosus]|uniref:Uncharacterized protein n=1 Tax=Didymodactylos carnosus TaxID=1234261 RepID=A0A8S2VU25_9BILA|nr:unnamed protein product [Didymodactylos carnosus]